jgi:hypothetical protein
MADVIPLWFMPLYGLLWAGVARLAVESWRDSQRGRTRRQMLIRLARWRHC